MRTTALSMLALVAASRAATLQPPIEAAKIGTKTSQGCFKGKGDWDFYELEPMSSGGCFGLSETTYANKNYTVTGLSTEGCYLGQNYPSKTDLVDDSNCDYVCPAWDKEACGGFKDDGSTFFSVYNLGVKIAVPYKSSGSSSSETSSATTPNEPTGTSGGQSQTPSSSDSPTNGEDSSGPSVGGIIGGVVAGVAIVGLIAGIGFWVWRRRRNQAIEEEHRRNATVNSFISGAKPPSSSGLSMTDSRMDPGMVHQRRLSDGSIADNQDYSRKILRVTNA